jgi:hypothetical protein
MEPKTNNSAARISRKNFKFLAEMLEGIAYDQLGIV